MGSSLFRLDFLTKQITTERFRLQFAYRMHTQFQSMPRHTPSVRLLSRSPARESNVSGLWSRAGRERLCWIPGTGGGAVLASIHPSSHLSIVHLAATRCKWTGCNATRWCWVRWYGWCASVWVTVGRVDVERVLRVSSKASSEDVPRVHHQEHSPRACALHCVG